MKYLLTASALLLFLASCGDDTGTCTTTCISKSTGDNLGSATFPNYTRSECEDQLAARETELTDCFLEFEKD